MIPNEILFQLSDWSGALAGVITELQLNKKGQRSLRKFLLECAMGRGEQPIREGNLLEMISSAAQVDHETSKNTFKHLQQCGVVCESKPGWFRMHRVMDESTPLDETRYSKSLSDLLKQPPRYQAFV